MNPTKQIGLLQSRHHHHDHFIKYNLFSPWMAWYSWKIAHLALNHYSWSIHVFINSINVYWEIDKNMNWPILKDYNCYIISSPDPKGQVSYCHHLASVVCRKHFQKFSPLKLLDQWKPNLVRIITTVSSFKIVSGDAVHQPTWLLLPKIEHGKIAGFG
jgi:hypothetical protein